MSRPEEKCLKNLLLHPSTKTSRSSWCDRPDLYYVIRNYGSGVEAVCEHLKPLLDEQETQEALKILKRDFSDPDQLGPRRVAEFLYAGPDETLQADVVGFVRELLMRCGMV